CARTIAWANLRAEIRSRGRSFLVLRLVSTARTIESGRADSLLKIAIFCSLPSSFRTKFSFCKFASGAPCASVTVTKTFTSFTSTLMVSESCAVRSAQRIESKTRSTCRVRGIESADFGSQHADIQGDGRRYG